jgi:hypothetical protein
MGRFVTGRVWDGHQVMYQNLIEKVLSCLKSLFLILFLVEFLKLLFYGVDLVCIVGNEIF